MLELNKMTLKLVNLIFEQSEVPKAINFLENDCDNLPIYEKATPDSMGCIRFAAIKLSEGRIENLQQSISIAQKDWRHLLLFSGFAEDIHAHKIWAKGIIGQ
jgi:hypothetical protein